MTCFFHTRLSARGSAAPSGSKGYSLAEILAAIALTAVVSSIAVPNLVSFSTEYRLVSTADQVAFDISRARMKAVGENVFCRVRFGNSGGSSRYWIEKSSDGTTYALDGSVQYLPDGISLPTLPSVIPSFNRQGLAPSASSITVINRDNQSKTIQVNVLGRVTIQ